jgi:hypothetical protein
MHWGFSMSLEKGKGTILKSWPLATFLAFKDNFMKINATTQSTFPAM